MLNAVSEHEIAWREADPATQRVFLLLQGASAERVAVLSHDDDGDSQRGAEFRGAPDDMVLVFLEGLPGRCLEHSFFGGGVWKPGGRPILS